ncbi:MAG: ribonuclease PH [Planctomycetota bacterium]|nr:ribonuclease PH [Planctomycetota bacterium]MDI6788526.1 ribonuclease PH [Planctomycetota bacterium]
MRLDNRKFDEIRAVKITPNFVSSSAGSALIELGSTKVLCSANWELKVPDFLRDKGQGWVTAEYGMLPGSTQQRKPRESRTGRPDGRTFEIQRLIGRALRAVVDMELLGEKTIWIDCDVLEADGGTRTAAITGSFVALYQVIKKMISERLLLKNPIRSHLAAVSVGKVNGELILDLSYQEDSIAEVDMNVVMTDKEEIIEIQGTAEQRPFSQDKLIEMLNLAKKGIKELIEIQQKIISKFSIR